MVEELVDVGKLVGKRRSMGSLQEIHQLGAPVDGWRWRGYTGGGDAWRGLNLLHLQQAGSSIGKRAVDGRRMGLLGKTGVREAWHWPHKEIPQIAAPTLCRGRRRCTGRGQAWRDPSCNCHKPV